MREWGSAERLPGRPAARRKDPACGESHAVGVHRRLEELHCVVDRQTAEDAAARGVDVDVDVALRIVRLEEQELRDDDVGDVIIDGSAEENDPVHEEPGENIVGPLATAGALDDVGRVECRHLFFLSSRFELHSFPAATGKPCLRSSFARSP